MLGLELHLDPSGAIKVTDSLARAVEDWRKPINSFRAYMLGEINKQIQEAGDGVAGGTARGVRWSGYKPQYVRRDGTVVQAWGDVTKIRGKGSVKGKLRGNRFRVSRGSRLFEGTRASSWLRLFREAPTEIAMKPAGPAAEAQNAIRQMIFYQNPKDAEKFAAICQRWIGARVRIAERKAR